MKLSLCQTKSGMFDKTTKLFSIKQTVWGFVENQKKISFENWQDKTAVKLPNFDKKNE